MPQAPDPYRVLGVKPNATQAQIKAAHRALAKRYHPDAQGGDAVSFLLVQEAYKLLSDPLRRREWDARHAPGPVRAGQPATTRPRAADGRWTRADPSHEVRTDRRPPTAGRDPAARRYTWSAAEVPWWEEGASRGARRQPGRRRPRETQPAAGEPAGSGRQAGDARRSGAARRAGAAHGVSADQPGSAKPDAQQAAPGPAADPVNDFDVYNRSSGAAWSMAARAYFRRGDQDLPRHGSFRHEGSQPLTAARARVAAEEETRRQRPSPGRARSANARPAPAAPAARPAPASAPAPARRATTAGVARDVHGISEARQAARQRASAAAWPSLGQRLVFAFVAWIPLALAIGYGGAVATGCDRAAIGCPSYLEPVQQLLTAVALGLLLALPRVAYVGALATVVLLGASALIVAGAWLIGLRPPLPSSVLAISSALLLLIYLATATWIVAGGPRRRPWSA